MCRRHSGLLLGAGTDQPTHKLGSTLTIWRTCTEKNLISGQRKPKTALPETNSSKKGRNQNQVHRCQTQEQQKCNSRFTNRVSFTVRYVPFKSERHAAYSRCPAFFSFRAAPLFWAKWCHQLTSQSTRAVAGSCWSNPALTDSTSATLCFASKPLHRREKKLSQGKGEVRGGTWSSATETTYDHLPSSFRRAQDLLTQHSMTRTRSPACNLLIRLDAIGLEGED